MSGILKMLDNILTMPDFSRTELQGFYEYQLQHDFGYWEKILDFDLFIGAFESGVYKYLSDLKF